MASLTEKAARGTLWHILAQGTVMLSAYVVAVVLARSLGPAAYGIYGLIYSVLISVELIGRFGIPQTVSRMIAEQGLGTAALEATGLGLAMLVYLGLFVAFWLAAPQLAAGLGLAAEEGTRLLRIAALDIPFFGLFFMAVHILNGHRAFAQEAIANIVYALTKAAGIGLLAWHGATIAGALIINVLGSIVGLGLLVLLIGRVRLAFDRGLTRRILALALPIGLTGVGTQLLTGVDLWSLGLFGQGIGEEVRGWYVAALNIARMPNVLAFVMTAVLIPSLAGALAEGEIDLARRTLTGALRFLALTLLPGCALVAVEAEPLLSLLFSADYAPGGELLRLLSFGHGLWNTLFFTAIAVLIATGGQQAAAALGLAAVPVAFAANALLVPAFGAHGAAIAALLVPAIATLAAAWIIWRRLGPLPDAVRLLRAVPVAGILALLAWLLPASGLWLLLELAGLGLVLPLLAVFTGLLGPSDLTPFRTSQGRVGAAPAAGQKR
jgi:O-antigen/teichoic acid export membrane protein